MRSFNFLTPLFLPAIFVVACGTPPTESATPNDATEVATVPMSNFNKNPDGGSLHHFRYQSHVVFAIFDPNSTLAAAITTADQCGGGVLEPADIQDIDEDPSAFPFTRSRQLIQADPVNIHVIDESLPGDCFGFLQVAAGTGKAIYTDNDVFAFLTPDNNHNAFGIKATGKLVGDEGQPWHFSGHGRFTWDGEDFATLKVNEKFNLKTVGQ